MTDVHGDHPPIEPVEREVTEQTALSEVTLAEMASVFDQAENYVRAYWHDPRYCVQFLLGLLQLLRNEEATVHDIVSVDIGSIKPVTDLS